MYVLECRGLEGDGNMKQKEIVKWSVEINGCGSVTDSSEIKFAALVRTRSKVLPLT